MANSFVARADEIGIRQSRLQPHRARLEIAWELGDRGAVLGDLEMPIAKLLQRRRLTQTSVAFFKLLQTYRDGIAPDPEAAEHWLQSDQPPAFLPQAWLLVRTAPERGQYPDVDPTACEALWIAPLEGRLDDQETLELDDATLRESGAWRKFANARPVPGFT